MFGILSATELQISVWAHDYFLTTRCENKNFPVDFKNLLEDVNVGEVNALVGPDIIGTQRRQRQQIFFPLFIIYSGFVALRKASGWGAWPAIGSQDSGSPCSWLCTQPWGTPFQSLVPKLPTLSVKCLHIALGAVEEKSCCQWFPLEQQLGLTGVCYGPTEAQGHSRNESGGRWCQRPSNQPNFHLLCVLSGWWRGHWCRLDVFSASEAALDTQSWCSWTPAGAGTCLFSGALCGNASSDRHMPFTLAVPDWALGVFENRKKLPQICGCREQTTLMESFGALKDKLMYFPPRRSLNEGSPGKMSFSNLENAVYGIWSPPWPRNQVCHFSGSFHSLHGDWGQLTNGRILLLQPLPSLSPSPLVYITVALS